MAGDKGGSGVAGGLTIPYQLRAVVSPRRSHQKPSVCTTFDEWLRELCPPLLEVHDCKRFWPFRHADLERELQALTAKTIRPTESHELSGRRRLIAHQAPVSGIRRTLRVFRPPRMPVCPSDIRKDTGKAAEADIAIPPTEKGGVGASPSAKYANASRVHREYPAANPMANASMKKSPSSTSNAAP